MCWWVQRSKIFKKATKVDQHVGYIYAHEYFLEYMAMQALYLVTYWKENVILIIKAIDRMVSHKPCNAWIFIVF